MDLSTVQAKIDNGMYGTRQEFADDIRLIVSNCKTFNLAGTPIYKTAETFEVFFEKGESARHTVADLQSGPRLRRP